jgi:hypothetical protein
MHNYYFLDIFKDVDFPSPEINVNKSYENNALRLDLSTNDFAWAVFLKGLPDLARPDDNYFNLLPGLTKTIKITNISREEAENLTVTSLAAVRSKTREKIGV